MVEEWISLLRAAAEHLLGRRFVQHKGSQNGGQGQAEWHRPGLDGAILQ
jgi:hypothetical protein